MTALSLFSELRWLRMSPTSQKWCLSFWPKGVGMSWVMLTSWPMLNAQLLRCSLSTLDQMQHQTYVISFTFHKINLFRCFSPPEREIILDQWLDKKTKHKIAMDSHELLSLRQSRRSNWGDLWLQAHLRPGLPDHTDWWVSIQPQITRATVPSAHHVPCSRCLQPSIHTPQHQFQMVRTTPARKQLERALRLKPQGALLHSHKQGF